ncbi:hypothetical protein [Bradyrhizobium glycinis]|uniref:hypothetical protein n=1 Tax=Bradyrhizobium glycinis TaxID=2751812 RepID=UPI0018D6963A|nr:hypothetical protein [Bradyrhizobium glycinis]MBH5369026.1 hypothetical protein [Bradyrhizobium glycinis]
MSNDLAKRHSADIQGNVLIEEQAEGHTFRGPALQLLRLDAAAADAMTRSYGWLLEMQEP